MKQDRPSAPECCHHVLNAEGKVLDAFPLLCVGVPDHECCEPHGADRVFPTKERA